MRPPPDDDALTVFEVPLDDESVARLMSLSDAVKVPPLDLIASIVHDVLRDDEAAHGGHVDVATRADAHKLN